MNRLITILCLISICAVAAVRKPAEVPRGAGAQALRSKPKHKAVPSTAGLMPSIVVMPPQPVTFFFAATAMDSGSLESDYSDEVPFVRTNYEKSVILAWDADTGTSSITNYNIYFGRSSRTYTNITAAGTNLSVSIQLVPPPLTNVVISIYGLGTNLSLTNPPDMKWFKGTNLTISKRYF
jgi:hypothetical protein